MNFRKFWKNTKAISPTISSIIIVAVTVAVSVASVGWLGETSVGFMGKTEEVAITSVQFASNYVNVTVPNSGTVSVTLQETATIDGNKATLGTTGSNPSFNVLKGNTGYYLISLASGNFASGAQYTFKLTTIKGTALVYTATAP